MIFQDAGFGVRVLGLGALEIKVGVLCAAAPLVSMCGEGILDKARLTSSQRSLQNKSKTSNMLKKALHLKSPASLKPRRCLKTQKNMSGTNQASLTQQILQHCAAH